MTGLSAVLGEINKKMKKTNPDIVFDPESTIDWIDSGCLTFNMVASGNPKQGFPRGRITEVFGLEHSGKTAILSSAAAKIQQGGGVAILLDFENAFDPSFAQEAFGLHTDNKSFAVFSPETVEQGDELLESLGNLDQIDLLAWDSIDGSKPKGIIESTLDKEQRVGAHAKAVGRIIQKLKRLAKAKNCAVVMTNQMRANINTNAQAGANQGTGAGHVDDLTTTGGYSPRYYCSLRIKMEYGGAIWDEKGQNDVTGKTGKTRIGNQIRIINIKNKVAPPFRRAEAHFDFPTPNQKPGWNQTKDLIKILKGWGRIAQRGTKLEYTGYRAEDWSNLGSKAASEKLFGQQSHLIQDALQFLKDNGTARRDADEIDDRPEPISLSTGSEETPKGQIDDIVMGEGPSPILTEVEL